MSTMLTAKSPVFWVVVFAGAVLPALVLRGVAQVVVVLFVVAFVATGLVRARRHRREATGKSH